MLREAFFPNGKPLEIDFDLDSLEIPTLSKGQKIYKGKAIE